MAEFRREEREGRSTCRGEEGRNNLMDYRMTMMKDLNLDLGRCCPVVSSFLYNQCPRPHSGRSAALVLTLIHASNYVRVLQVYGALHKGSLTRARQTLLCLGRF